MARITPKTTMTGMNHRKPGGPASASGVATIVTGAVAVGAGVGVGVGSGVGVGVDVAVEVAVGSGVGVAVGTGVAVGSGVGVAVGAGVGGGPTRNCVWPVTLRSARSTFLTTPAKAYCPSRVGTVTT